MRQEKLAALVSHLELSKFKAEVTIQELFEKKFDDFMKSIKKDLFAKAMNRKIMAYFWKKRIVITEANETLTKLEDIQAEIKKNVEGGNDNYL